MIKYHLISSYLKFIAIALFSTICVWPDVGYSSTGDQLKIHTIDISGRILELPLPDKGLSKDVLAESQIINSQLDLNLVKPNERAVLVHTFYDWKASPILPGVRGTMIIFVAVSRMPTNVSATCELKFRKAIQEGIDFRKQESFHKSSEAKSNDILDDNIHVLNGAKAIVVTESLHNNSVIYRIPISDMFYLSVSYSLIPNIGTSEQLEKWRMQAKAVIKRMVNGMQFKGDWAQFKDCKNSP